MELREFVAAVPNFSSLSHPNRILHFGWYIHYHQGEDRFSQSAVRSCYGALQMDGPNFSEQFKRLIEKRPKVLLQDTGGYYLEHNQRQALDAKYGQHETTIAISKLLGELPGKISNQAEKHFLSEAITCYRNRAFRATIIMTWNLTYDHLLNWILADPKRLSAFQAHIAGRIGPKKAAGMTIAKREDFEDLKESEAIDICGTAQLFASDNTKRILEIQLTKRNLAAHPSLVTIGAPQAEDAISDLVSNVVLMLV
jgi:hypothetical protein